MQWIIVKHSCIRWELFFYTFCSITIKKYNVQFTSILYKSRRGSNYPQENRIFCENINERTMIIIISGERFFREPKYHLTHAANTKYLSIIIFFLLLHTVSVFSETNIIFTLAILSAYSVIYVLLAEHLS